VRWRLTHYWERDWEFLRVLPLIEGEMGEAQRGSELIPPEMGEAQRGSELIPPEMGEAQRGSALPPTSASKPQSSPLPLLVERALQSLRAIVHGVFGFVHDGAHAEELVGDAGV